MKSEVSLPYSQQCILSQIVHVHSFTIYFFNTHFNIILSSRLRLHLQTGIFTFRFSDENIACICHPNAFYMSRPPLHSR